jgi:RNA polymerase sigma-70 factor (ECF subfamily)
LHICWLRRRFELEGSGVTRVTALVTKIQQELNCESTPGIFLFRTLDKLGAKQWAGMLKSRVSCQTILSGQGHQQRFLTMMSRERDGTGHVPEVHIENIDGLYSYAMILTRNQAEAEDLVQETYVRAISAMGRLRDGSNMKGWLFTILRNVWFNQLRKWRNGHQMTEIQVKDGDADSFAGPSKDSHDLYVNKMEAERVRAAIQELPVDFREIILLREYEDLSYREIASVLDCPVGTVMSRLGRARAKLRGVLAPIFKGPDAPLVSGTE